jgi:hypothetical protein
MSVKLTDEHLDALFQRASDAIERRYRERTLVHAHTYAGAVLDTLCTLMGTLPHGGNAQIQMMDAATRQGFTPSYYAGSIRMGYGRTE